MLFPGWHREDIKAMLRRRYGTVFAFETAKGLPRTSVSDVLRGRRVERAEAAIRNELATPDPDASEVRRPSSESDLSDASTALKPRRTPLEPRSGSEAG